MKMPTASDFEKRCAAILNAIDLTGETVTILKGGKLFAQLIPSEQRVVYPQDTLKGTGRIMGDIIEPPLPPEAWDAERGEYEP